MTGHDEQQPHDGRSALERFIEEQNEAALAVIPEEVLVLIHPLKIYGPLLLTLSYIEQAVTLQDLYIDSARAKAWVNAAATYGELTFSGERTVIECIKVRVEARRDVLLSNRSEV